MEWGIEPRYRQAIQQAPIGLVVFDQELRFGEINDYASCVLALPRERVVGRTLGEVLGEEEGEAAVAAVERIFREALATGARTRFAGWQVRRGRGPDQALHVDWEVRRIDGVGMAPPCLLLTFSDVSRHVRDRQALEQLTARCHAFADRHEHLAWVADTQGRLAYVNRRWSGYTGHSAVGEDWRAVIHPEDAEAGTARWQEALDQGHAYEAELRIRGEDGAYRWHLVRTWPVLDQHGRPGQWVGTASDIHERRVGDDQPLGREEQLRLLVETSQEHAIILLDRDGVVRSWNPGAARILGYEEAEIIGQPSDLFFTEEDRAAGLPQQERRLAIEDGQSTDERWHRRKDGERFFASGFLTAIRDRGGSLRGFSKIMRDLTQRKRIEEELRRSRERLELAQTVGRIGTFDWDIATDRMAWTPGQAELHGIRLEDFSGTFQDWADRILPEDWPRVRAAYAQAIEQRIPLQIEFRVVWPDGTVRWIQDHGRVEYGADGKPLRMIGVNIDITERKQAEEALRQANRELEQFAYIASHDLQEPLRMVGNYLGLLRRRYAGQLDAAALSYIGYAVDGAERMQRLIRHLLDFARIDRSRLSLRAFDSGQLVDEVCEHLRERLEETGGSITRGELPTVLADRAHLGRVFQNLIANGLKYFRPGVPPRLRIDAQASEHEWVFTVQDNGIGIAPADRERIFELFERLHSRDEYPGTGIGLAICRKIIERHHGRIWVDAAPGGGTVFAFSLPMRPPTGD